MSDNQKKAKTSVLKKVYVPLEYKFLLMLNLFMIAILSGNKAVKTESGLMISVFMIAAILGVFVMLWYGFASHKTPGDSQQKKELTKKQTAAAYIVAIVLAAVIIIAYTYGLFWVGLLPL